MNICVAGLWHLGAVTAACLTSFGHCVIGVDSDPRVVAQLNQGHAPLHEPGLDDLIRQGLTSKQLIFTSDSESACSACEVLWIAYDTSVNEDDEADVGDVLRQAQKLLPALKAKALIIVSSQLPVGSVGQLEQYVQDHHAKKEFQFACIPENLRLGKALEVFCKPDRVVVGVRTKDVVPSIEIIYQDITTNIEWMSVESAEMVKHATNAFLALSVTFANEIATLCESVGADAKAVERALKKDIRIGPKAYLAPGGPFAGGTLARDIEYLSKTSQQFGLSTQLLTAVRQSNDQHKKWATRKLSDYFPSLDGVPIALWGLTYKPGTSTLRRSTAIELCEWLLSNGAIVHAHDPAVPELPPALTDRVVLHTNALDAVCHASALVISTEWPIYKLEAARVLASVKQRLLVIDANRYIIDNIDIGACDYVAVGTPTRSRVL